MGKVKLSELGPLSEEDRQMLQDAAAYPITFDDDCPESTPEMLAAFRKEAEKRRSQRRKSVLSIRVSSETLEKARALGPGYSSILARMIERGLNDPETIRKCL